MKREIIKAESGEVMIEAALVLVFVILMSIALLALCFFIYQQVMLNSIACEIATRVAENYKISRSDLDINAREIGKEYYTKLNKFRLLFNGNSEGIHSSRASAYLPDRIYATSLGLDDSEPNVKVTINHDNIGRAHAHVEISVKSKFLFGAFLEFYSFSDETAVLSASADANVFDITGYAGNVKFSRFLFGNSVFAPAEVAAEIYGEGKGTVDHLSGIVDIVKKWMGIS